MGFFSNFNHNTASSHNLDQMAKKIELIYQDYAARYGASNFDINNYRDRYIEYLKSKADLMLFYESELRFLEQRKLVFESKKKKEAEKERISNKMDSIINDIFEQTKKYPEEFIDERANTEMRKLVGACKFLYPELMSLKFVIPMAQYTNLVHSLSYIEDLVQEPYGRNYKNYIETVQNYINPISKAEVFGQKTLKDVGLALNRILEIIKELEPRIQPIHVIEYIEGMLRDFRLNIFQ